MAGRSEFPFSKLIYMIVRQTSRPVAKRVRMLAEASPIFKKYVCLPPALFYMWSERVVDNLARGGPAKVVPPYVEKKAVRLGSNLIGEFIIFGIAATFITLEFLRQRRKRRQRMQEEMLEKTHLRRRAMESQYNRDRRKTELKELQERADDLQRRLLGGIKVDKVDDRTEPDSVSGIRIEDAYLEHGVKVRAFVSADVEKKMRSEAEAARTIATMEGHDKEEADLKAKAAAVTVKETSTSVEEKEKEGFLKKTREMEKEEKLKKVDEGGMEAGSTRRGAEKVAVALEAPTIEDYQTEKKKIMEKVEKHVEKQERREGVERREKPIEDKDETLAEKVEAPTELELAVTHTNPLDVEIEMKDDRTPTSDLEASVHHPGKSLIAEHDETVLRPISELAWYSLLYVFGGRRRSSSKAQRSSSGGGPTSGTEPETASSPAPSHSPTPD